MKEVRNIPPDYRQYKVLDEHIFSSEEEMAKGIYKAVQMVMPMDGPVVIRVCYYTKRRRNDGTVWWGLSLRPPHFLPEDAQKVANYITELADKYSSIESSMSDKVR